MYQIASKTFSVIVRIVRFAPILLVFLVALAVAAEFVIYKFSNRTPMVNFILHELPFRGKNFSKEAWDDIPFGNGSDTSCFRGGMVRSLLHKHLIVGETTFSSVEGLLGKSEYEVQIGKENCSGYYLGFCSGFAMDSDSLFTCFDERNLLSEVGTVQH